MTYDPIDDVHDEQLAVNSKVILSLSELRGANKFVLLPGVDNSLEKDRLSKLINELLDVLIDGLEANNSKLWVTKQFQKVLEHVQSEDTEAREHFGTYLENVMEELGIESSDGLLSCYLGGI